MQLPTYQQQLDFVKQGLAVASVNDNLTTFKYHRKVMYEYLWDKHPELKECRGHTYDNQTGELVALPLTKTFAYLENDTWQDKPLTEKVTLCKKYNGYMLAVSKHRGQLVFSTTGSTKSEYCKWGKEMFEQSHHWQPQSSFTDLYEVVVGQDPHIVNENCGIYFLGSRCKDDNEWWSPLSNLSMSLKEALSLSKTDKGEGWMMYDAQGNIAKLKTDYYVGKKKLMRMSKKNVEQMYNNPNNVSLPDQWKHAPALIVSKFDVKVWTDMQDQQRRVFLEEIEV